MAREVSPEIDDARARIEEDVGQQEESDHGGRPEEHDDDEFGNFDGGAGRRRDAVLCHFQILFSGVSTPSGDRRADWRARAPHSGGTGAAHRWRSHRARRGATPCAAGWTVVPASYLYCFIYLYILFLLYFYSEQAFPDPPSGRPDRFFCGDAR